MRSLKRALTTIDPGENRVHWKRLMGAPQVQQLFKTLKITKISFHICNFFTASHTKEEIHSYG